MLQFELPLALLEVPGQIPLLFALPAQWNLSCIETQFLLLSALSFCAFLRRGASCCTLASNADQPYPRNSLVDRAGMT